MVNFKLTAVAATLALSSAAAFALPTFSSGVNSIEYKNYETLYRTNANCAPSALGGCLAATTGDPSGYRRVNPSIVDNVKLGDVFVGILDVQRVTYMNGASTSYGTGLQEFSGYFAQQVTGSNSTAGRLDLSAATVDPFGILAAGEMFRFYVDKTYDFSFVGATPMDTIKTVVDKTQSLTVLDPTSVLWASFDVADGYAYTLTNFAALIGGNGSNTEAHLGMDTMFEGPAYNVKLAKVNDTNEELVGGNTASFLCSAADLANPNVICNNLVATSEIEGNPNWVGGTGVAKNSPWVFRSNDPADMYVVPEPGSLALLGLGLAGLSLVRRRRSV